MHGTFNICYWGTRKVFPWHQQGNSVKELLLGTIPLERQQLVIMTRWGDIQTHMRTHTNRPTHTHTHHCHQQSQHARTLSYFSNRESQLSRPLTLKGSHGCKLVYGLMCRVIHEGWREEEGCSEILSNNKAVADPWSSILCSVCWQCVIEPTCNSPKWAPCSSKQWDSTLCWSDILPVAAFWHRVWKHYTCSTLASGVSWKFMPSSPDKTLRCRLGTKKQKTEHVWTQGWLSENWTVVATRSYKGSWVLSEVWAGQKYYGSLRELHSDSITDPCWASWRQ